MPGNRGRLGAFAAVVVALAFGGCMSLPQPTPPSPSLTPTAPTPSPTATPTLAPTPSPSPEPTMPPESPIDTTSWSSLVWSEAMLETPTPGVAVRVSDVARWGDGYVAVGSSDVTDDATPSDALIWLSEDGLEWRLVSDGSDTFAEAGLCCVTRARDAFIAWTRDSGVFLSSVDGRSWQRTERQVDGYGLAVAETADGLFALPRALFEGSVFTTTDGIAWAEHATTGLHLVTAAGFGRGGGHVAVTHIGYFVAGYAAKGGIHGVVADWGNWYSRDGREWQEVRFVDDGEIRGTGGNAGWFEEGHNYVYGHEFVNTGVFLGKDWVNPTWQTSDGVSWAEADVVNFPDAGRYDGHYTFDMSTLADDGTLRISPDGQATQTLAGTGDTPARPALGGLGQSSLGPRGIVVGGDVANPKIWFGRAVRDLSTAKPSVYCGRIGVELCLRLIGRVTEEGSEDGAAFVVDQACIYFSCWDQEIVIVAVPPDWPTSGALNAWGYDEATDRIRRSGVALPAHVRAKLPQSGPWRDPIVGDHIWVHLGSLGGVDARQVLGDHWLAGPLDPVGWVAARILDGYPPAAKLAQLRRDHRVCGADFVRFDPSLLRGESDAVPLPFQDLIGCT